MASIRGERVVVVVDRRPMLLLLLLLVGAMVGVLEERRQRQGQGKGEQSRASETLVRSVRYGTLTLEGRLRVGASTPYGGASVGNAWKTLGPLPDPSCGGRLDRGREREAVPTSAPRTSLRFSTHDATALRHS